MKKITWKRKLIITFTSTTNNSSISYGKNEKDNLSISVKGTKYLSPFKDSFTVEISNIPLLDIIKLRNGRYFLIKVEAGYESIGAQTIFDGAVLFISNRRDDHNTNTCVVLCANKAVAWYGQNKMCISLSSGINMYTAYSYIAKMCGLKKVSLDESLKKVFLSDNETGAGSVSNWIYNLSSNSSSTLINTDYSSKNELSVWGSGRDLRGKIKLDSSNVIAQGGFPRLTENGIQLKILPTFNLLTGDTVILDNSIVDIYAESKEDVYKNFDYYLSQSGDPSDSNGEYIVYQIDYDLNNRNSTFELEINLRSRRLYKGLVK